MKEKIKDILEVALPLALVLLILVCILSVIIVVVENSTYNAALENEYPMAFTVTDISENTNTLLLVDYSGNIWAVKGYEDLAVSDIVAAIVDNNGTPADISDDTIKELQYCGKAFE